MGRALAPSDTPVPSVTCPAHPGSFDAWLPTGHAKEVSPETLAAELIFRSRRCGPDVPAGQEIGNTQTDPGLPPRTPGELAEATSPAAGTEEADRAGDASCRSGRLVPS